MFKLVEHKSQTEHKPIKKAPLPALAYIPLSQHLGKICTPQVKSGDNVFLGQKIAVGQGHVWSPIHASVSGKVLAIQECPHPSLGKCQAIVIENDGADRLMPKERFDPIDQLTAIQVRNIIFESGIVGMGGAAFPTHIKLDPPKPVEVLIVNGAECEPYLTSDDRLMIERTQEIFAGIDLVVKCTGVKHVYIAIEENKPEAIEAFRKRLPKNNFSLKVLKAQYPQGGEKQLIQEVLKCQVPSGKLPFDLGVVVQNVATINAIYEAVYLGKPLYERVVTVSGDCLKTPENLLVRIGTTAKELLEFCGPFIKHPQKVIFGGPMMGLAQYTLDTPVIKSTNGIICLSESEPALGEQPVCLKCARCVENCPLGLEPCLISLASEKEKWGLAKAYGCLECMECGLCNYLCPQKRNIVQSIKYAKLKSPK